MTRRVLIALLAVVALVPSLHAQAPAAPSAPAADITGKWAATFETAIGEQTYTFEFLVKDGVLTGKITSSLGDATMEPGKVEGNKVTFVESLSFMDMPIAITYTGQIASADEIKFTRNVADFATEELVAKRVKP